MVIDEPPGVFKARLVGVPEMVDPSTVAGLPGVPASGAMEVPAIVLLVPNGDPLDPSEVGTSNIGESDILHKRSRVTSLRLCQYV